MSEQQTKPSHPEVLREIGRLASEADRSLKAALYSVQAKDAGLDIIPEELRHDVRRAAIDHKALMDGMRDSGQWASMFGSSNTEMRVMNHLGFDDLGTPQESLFLDRYAAWLRAPQTVESGQRSYNSVEATHQMFRGLSIFYGQQSEDEPR